MIPIAKQPTQDGRAYISSTIIETPAPNGSRTRLYVGSALVTQDVVMRPGPRSRLRLPSVIRLGESRV